MRDLSANERVECAFEVQTQSANERREQLMVKIVWWETTGGDYWRDEGVENDKRERGDPYSMNEHTVGRSRLEGTVDRWARRGPRSRGERLMRLIMGLRGPMGSLMVAYKGYTGGLTVAGRDSDEVETSRRGEAETVDVGSDGMGIDGRVRRDWREPVTVLKSYETRHRVRGFIQVKFG